MRIFLTIVLCALCVERADCIPSLHTEKVKPSGSGTRRQRLLLQDVYSNKSPLPPKNSVSELVEYEASVLDGNKLARKQTRSILMLSLASLSGMTCGICYRRFQCFPNMMTGNTVRWMNALADGKFKDLALHGTTVLSYVMGGGIFQMIPKTHHRRQDTDAILPYTHLVWVSGIVMAVFGISDFLGTRFDSWRMPFLAMGFGLINAAANDALGGSVTNAVTGHWTKVGLGVVERLILTDQKRTKGWTKSVKIVIAFMTSMLSTTIVYKWLETQPFIFTRLPPLGTSLGSVYALLFCWYSQSHQLI